MKFEIGDFVAFNRDSVTYGCGFKKINENEYLVPRAADPEKTDKYTLGIAYKVIGVEEGTSYIWIDNDPAGEEWPPRHFRKANAVEIARWKLKNE